MTKSFPDSPEAVAYALLLLILERQGDASHNQPPQAWILDLFVECLAAVYGESSGASSVAEIKH